MAVGNSIYNSGEITAILKDSIAIQLPWEASYTGCQ